ncbi:MAG TPA: (2Fe-2S) ferredoxin domain-containing protein [Bacteroidetes bacterium]|nr:(2Fe-2S) ferredoxin domain-containing protein [Bacteroidota bacterium]
MDQYKKHIFICVNERPKGHEKGSCAHRNAEAVFRKFRAELSARGLGNEYKATKSGCLASCSTGVNAVVYPEGIWYKGLVEDDVVRIIEEHFLAGRPVQELRLFQEQEGKLEG